MPSWTLADLCFRATARIGNRTELSLSLCSFWANQALEDFTRDVPELLNESQAWFSVSSGDSLLTVPADFYEPIVLSFQTQTGSNRTLHQVSPEWADSQGYYPVGEPQAFFIYADQIQLWPSANSSADTTVSSGRSYLLRYYANPGTMSVTTDVPSVATMHRIGILFKLEEYLHNEVGNLEEAAASNIKYLGFVTSLKDAMARRQAHRGETRASLPQRGQRITASLEDSDEWLRR